MIDHLFVKIKEILHTRLQVPVLAETPKKQSFPYATLTLKEAITGQLNFCYLTKVHLDFTLWVNNAQDNTALLTKILKGFRCYAQTNLATANVAMTGALKAEKTKNLVAYKGRLEGFIKKNITE